MREDRCVVCGELVDTSGFYEFELLDDKFDKVCADNDRCLKRYEAGERFDFGLLEEVANLAHKQWAGWMEYLSSKCEINDDGTITIPEHLVNRWKRQTNTDYDHLLESEQESDRNEAMKFIKLMKDHDYDNQT